MDKQILGRGGVPFTPRGKIRDINTDSAVTIILGILKILIDGIAITPIDVFSAFIIDTYLKTQRILLSSFSFLSHFNRSPLKYNQPLYEIKPEVKDHRNRQTVVAGVKSPAARSSDTVL